MAKLPTIYDLMLVLSTEGDDEARQRIISETESMIEQGDGRIELSQPWGMRPLAYEITHQPEGQYHLIQFGGPTRLLDSLHHTLRIEPGVLRFRIIKVVPGQPPAPATPPPVIAGSSGSGAPAFVGYDAGASEREVDARADEPA
jgi:small subunit ribosomal protein S6